MLLNSYNKLSEYIIGETKIFSWYSENLVDDMWDDFVFSLDDLIYEQSSLWARIKSIENWKYLRVIFTTEDKIIGGYQILFKEKKLFGKFGYLNRGPLFINNIDGFPNHFINNLKQILKLFKIRVLLFYPHKAITNQAEEGFLHNKTIQVDEAHFFIDLQKSEPELLKNMMRMRRQNIIKSLNSGIKIREGNSTELKLFFELMLKTCERQCVLPNPSKLTILEMIWELFSKRDLIKLYFTEYNNMLVTGCLTLQYKDKFIAWKVGWSGLHSDIKPNDGMHWLLMLKAKELGLNDYDFRGIDLKIFNEIKSSPNQLSREALSSPTFFKYGFNGQIKLFPESKIIIQNVFLRLGYKVFYHFSSRYPLTNKYFLKFMSFDKIQH